MVLPMILSPIAIAAALFIVVFGLGVFTTFIWSAVVLFVLSLVCLALAGGLWWWTKKQQEDAPISELSGVTVVSEGEETAIQVDGETVELPPDEATIVDAASNDASVDTIVDEIVAADPEIASFLSLLGVGDVVEGFGSVNVMPYCSRESRLPLIFGTRTPPYC